MKDCVFCKLANGEIPTETVLENERFRAIFDANPVSKGHTLILPKEHFENLAELPVEWAEAVLPFAKAVMAELNKRFTPDGFNVCQNNGAAAGQTVMHYHMHVIPRYAGVKLSSNIC